MNEMKPSSGGLLLELVLSLREPSCQTVQSFLDALALNESVIQQLTLVGQVAGQFIVALLDIERDRFQVVVLHLGDVTVQGREEVGGCELHVLDQSLVGHDVVVERFGTAQLVLHRLRFGTQRLVDDFYGLWGGGGGMSKQITSSSVTE